MSILRLDRRRLAPGCNRLDLGYVERLDGSAEAPEKQNDDATRRSPSLEQMAPVAARASADALSSRPDGGHNDLSTGRANARGEVERHSDQGETGTRDGQAARKVILRLSDGERVPVGVYESELAAKEHAESLVWQLVTRRDLWQFFGGRFIRSETIVSVDLVAPEVNAQTPEQAHYEPTAALETPIIGEPLMVPTQAFSMDTSVGDVSSVLTERQQAVIDFIGASGKTAAQLRSRFGDNVSNLLESLSTAGYVRVRSVQPQATARYAPASHLLTATGFAARS
jgi:hypothetical protein